MLNTSPDGVHVPEGQMRVVLLGILDPDPPAAKAKDGQDAEAHHHARLRRMAE